MKWIVLEDFRSPSGRIAQGAVLDDLSTDVQSLRRTGLAAVPSTNLLERLSQTAREAARGKGLGHSQADLMSLLLARGQLGGFTDQRLDLHLSVNGDDRAEGTAKEPLRTIEEAYARVPNVRHPVVLHLGAGTYDLPTLHHRQMRDAVYLYGTTFNELVPSTAAQAGSDAVQVVTAGLTPDQYRGKTVEILTGNAAGDRREIRDHDATTIIPSMRFSADVVAGDTFRIFDPSQTVLRPTSEPIAVGIGAGKETQFSLSHDRMRSHLGLVNVTLDVENIGPVGSTELRFPWSAVHMYGVEIIGGNMPVSGVGLLNAGMQTRALTEGVTQEKSYEAVDVFGAPRDTSWSGWGAHFVEGANQGLMLVRDGMVAQGAFVAERIIFEEAARGWLRGGSCNLSSASGVRASYRSQVRIAGFGIPFKTTGVYASAGSQIWADGVEVSGGSGFGAGSHSSQVFLGFSDVVTIDADVGLMAGRGGRLSYRADRLTVTAPTETRIEDPVGGDIDHPLADYLAALHYFAAGDGSVIQRLF